MYVHLTSIRKKLRSYMKDGFNGPSLYNFGDSIPTERYANSAPSTKQLAGRVYKDLISLSAAS